MSITNSSVTHCDEGGSRLLQLHDLERLLTDSSFYYGESCNPIHRAMKLPIAVIKIAHLVCRPLNIYLARNSKFDQIVFTNEEEQHFARCIITANKHLSAHGMTTLPLIHLTPRMLLDYQEKKVIETTAEHPSFKFSENSTRVPIDIIDEDDQENEVCVSSSGECNGNSATKKGRKKKHHRKKSKTPESRTSNSNYTAMPVLTTNIQQQPCLESAHFNVGVEDNTSMNIQNIKLPELTQDLIGCDSNLSDVLKDRKRWNFDQFSVAHKSEFRQLIDNLSEDNHECVHIVSTLFEDYITDIREQYEESLQTLNMRLYLANNSLEAMTEKYNALKQQTLT